MLVTSTYSVKVPDAGVITGPGTFTDSTYVFAAHVIPVCSTKAKRIDCKWFMIQLFWYIIQLSVANYKIPLEYSYFSCVIYKVYCIQQLLALFCMTTTTF